MRTKQGIVTSAKMTGTVTVTVHRQAFHPKYKKRFRVSKKFLADNNGHEVHEGDLVTIGECRPISKNKHFKVMEIVKKGPVVSELAEESAVEAITNRKKKEEDDSQSAS